MTLDAKNAFNINYVELERLDIVQSKENGNAFSSAEQTTAQLANSTKLLNDDNTKFNSYPMRMKNSSANSKLKSSSSIAYRNDTSQQQQQQQQQQKQQYVMLTQEELNNNVTLAKARSQESEKLKQFLRTNCWPAKHPIRKYLWRTLLQSSSFHTGLAPSPHANKENKHNSESNSRTIDFTANEADYNKSLNHIFGKSREIETGLPDFVNNTSSLMNSSSSSGGESASNVNAINNNNHLNYYYLNSKGKQAIKRILCVYEYHFPHVTFSPGLVSISSVLLHYMQEHEVFAALCFMASTKEHLIESKKNWETNNSVFIRLLKNYCKSSFDIISKYAVDSLDIIFNDWYWWIFDCLSFDYLVKIMDCFLYEGLKVLFRVSLAIVQLFSKYLEFLFGDYNNMNESLNDVVKAESHKVNKDSIKHFCEMPTNIESIEKLLKMSFSIRNFKRSTMRDFFLKEESKRKTNHGANTSTPVSKALNKIDENQQQLQVQLKDTSPNRVFLNEATTSVLSHANLSAIWNWIPQRLTVYSPKMLFTTDEHGTSLNTLYNVLDNLEYCLLVIKTFQNETFGAFCSADWNERKQKKIYFGNGESFLFTIMPERKVYKWVGTKNQEKLDSHQELFIRADSNKIAIGGGGRDGLTISSNLIEGTTHRCNTFDNEPLASSDSFQIAILEVIGFEIK